MNKIQKNHVKKGDQVKVISGEQKGVLGIIRSIIKKKSSVILDSVLPRIKYLKNSQTKQTEESKKVELPILIHVSNVMLWDKEGNKPSRIGYKTISKPEKVDSTKSLKQDSKDFIKQRYFKKSGNLVPN